MKNDLKVEKPYEGEIKYNEEQYKLRIHLEKTDAEDDENDQVADNAEINRAFKEQDENVEKHCHHDERRISIDENMFDISQQEYVQPLGYEHEDQIMQVPLEMIEEEIYSPFKVYAKTTKVLFF